MSGLKMPMLVGAPVAAQSVFRPPVSGALRDLAPDQAGAINPQTDGAAAETGRERSSKPRVQPASQTDKRQGPTAGKTATSAPLSEEEDRQVRDLKQAEAEVRAHEQAHATAGGPYTGAPSYQFTTGPDGKRYATSGEVEIDTAPVRDDQAATIRKMDVVIRAALAPAEPSSQDLAVARAAQAQRAKAQGELLKQRTGGGDEEGAPRASARAGGLGAKIAEAAAAYARTADTDNAGLAEEIFAAAQSLSIVV